MKFLNDKINSEIDHYNQHTFDWSKGYKKAISDVIEYVLKFKK